MIQPKKQLADQIIEKLQNSIKLEYESGLLYEGMSAWLDNKSFINTSKFYRIHGLEERKHASWIIDYLQDMNVLVKIPSLEGPKYEWESIKDILEKTYEHEEVITKNWNDIATLSLKTADHMTYNFAQKLLTEQREELELFSELIDLYNLANGSDHQFDDEVEHPTYTLPSWVN